MLDVSPVYKKRAKQHQGLVWEACSWLFNVLIKQNRGHRLGSVIVRKYQDVRSVVFQQAGIEYLNSLFIVADQPLTFNDRDIKSHAEQ